MTVYLVCVVDGCFTYGGITCVVLVCASGGEARVWKALVRHEFCVRGAHSRCIRAPHVCVIPTDGITTKLFRIFPGDHEAGITVYFPRGTSVALPWGRTKPNHSYTYVPCTGKLALDGKGFSNRRYGKVGSMLLVSVSSSVFYHVRDLSFKSWGPFHFLYLEHSRCSC